MKLVSGQRSSCHVFYRRLFIFFLRCGLWGGNAFWGALDYWLQYLEWLLGGKENSPQHHIGGQVSIMYLWVRPGETRQHQQQLLLTCVSQLPGVHSCTTYTAIHSRTVQTCGHTNPVRRLHSRCWLTQPSVRDVFSINSVITQWNNVQQ